MVGSNVFHIFEFRESDIDSDLGTAFLIRSSLTIDKEVPSRSSRQWIEANLQQLQRYANVGKIPPESPPIFSVIKYVFLGQVLYRYRCCRHGKRFVS
jgi:hypothetical protein